MYSPLTLVLLKIFAKGFYRVHSGLLLFLFLTIMTYGFFINVLDENHIPKDQRILNNLGLVLGMLSSPLMLVAIFVAWFFLTAKSWSYVYAQIHVPANLFLRYSLPSMSKFRVWLSWFIVQLAISLPVFLYGMFALLIGLIFGYYFVPVLILSYAVLLSAISALVYTRYSYAARPGEWKIVFGNLFRRWPKPLPSLFLYETLDRQKITFAVTKLASCAIMAAGVFWFIDQEMQQAAAITALGIAAAHSFFIYQSNAFENRYLPFLRNLPISPERVYLTSAVLWATVLIPEIIFLVVWFGPVDGLTAIALGLGTIMLFRSLLYRITPEMKAFLYAVFFLFSGFFLLVLLKLPFLLSALTLIFSFLIFRRDYFRLATVLKP